MERRRFGSAGPPIGVIGQGTWQSDTDERRTVIQALRAGLDLGMTHIDTAEMYGQAEPLIAEAIAGRRDEVFLVSKVLPENASLKGTVAACERSLTRLGTDRLDCYLLHWRGKHPLEDTVAAFERLEQGGKIRSWVVGDFDVSDLEELERIAAPGRPACNQVLYHLQERAIEHAVLPWCEQRGIAVVGYSPFGSGRFPGPRTAGGRVLAEIASAHPGASARTVALAFLVRRAPLFAIPKASDPDHVADNARAGELRLSAAEVEQIERAFPLGRRPRALPTV